LGSLQVSLIFHRIEARFRYPPKAPYTKEEDIIMQKLMEMYYSFAETGVPKFGDVALGPMANTNKYLMVNEIKDSKNPDYKELDTTFGNTKFWNLLS
jgi:hypothetical protein